VDVCRRATPVDVSRLFASELENPTQTIIRSTRALHTCRLQTAVGRSRRRVRPVSVNRQLVGSSATSLSRGCDAELFVELSAPRVTRLVAADSDQGFQGMVARPAGILVKCQGAGSLCLDLSILLHGGMCSPHAALSFPMFRERARGWSMAGRSD
jgi:hypothetical protein